MRLIESEHVVRVEKVGEIEPGVPFLIMELLDGEDLEAHLARRGALPVQEAVNYALQVCEGLAEAHAVGVVHRDIKPQNLFLVRQQDAQPRLKILDFGVARFTDVNADAEVLTATSQSIGSPMYMAPEQMRDARLVDERADLWSLGVVLYRMLAGKPPFEAPTVHALCAAILSGVPDPLPPGDALPAALGEAVMRCLERAPARRFRSVGALAACLAPHGGPDAEARLARIQRIEARRPSSLAPLDDHTALPTLEPLDEPLLNPLAPPSEPPPELSEPLPVSSAPRRAPEGSTSVPLRWIARVSLPALALLVAVAPELPPLPHLGAPAPVGPQAIPPANSGVVTDLASTALMASGIPATSAPQEPRPEAPATASSAPRLTTVFSEKKPTIPRVKVLSPGPPSAAPRPSLPEAPQDPPRDRTTDTRR
jgi:serine/threonine-protein kinase